MQHDLAAYGTAAVVMKREPSRFVQVTVDSWWRDFQALSESQETGVRRQDFITYAARMWNAAD